MAKALSPEEARQGSLGEVSWGEGAGGRAHGRCTRKARAVSSGRLGKGRWEQVSCAYLELRATVRRQHAPLVGAHPEPRAGGRAARACFWKSVACTSLSTALPIHTLLDWTLVPKKWKIRPRQDVYGRVRSSFIWDGEELEKPYSSPRAGQRLPGPAPPTARSHALTGSGRGGGGGFGSAVSLQPGSQQGSPGAWGPAEGLRRHGVTPDSFTVCTSVRTRHVGRGNPVPLPKIRNTAKMQK